MQDSSANDETFAPPGGVDDYVTVKQACVIINRSYPTTLKMVKAKKLLGYQAGSEWRVKKSELRRFLEHGNHPNWKD